MRAHEYTDDQVDAAREEMKHGPTREGGIMDDSACEKCGGSGGGENPWDVCHLCNGTGMSKAEIDRRFDAALSSRGEGGSDER